MAKIIGMPKLEINFKGLGGSAITRGAKGQAVLIIKEEKPGANVMKLQSLAGLTEEVKKTLSKENIGYIEDVFTMKPRELVVIRMVKSILGEDEEDPLTEGLTSVGDALAYASTIIDRNCWIAIADADEGEDKVLASFISDKNKFERKRFKAVVYQHAADDMRIVNFTTESAKRVGVDEMVKGKTLVPMILGALAGQPFTYSIIARTFDEIEYVTEPEEQDEAVDNGEFFLFNDEGKIRVGRGVNSKTTIGEGETNDMRFILIVETMDLIYSDILSVWNNSYKGLYKNTLDNQMLLVSALNGYFKALADDSILDDSFNNRAEIDIKKQQLANLPIFGEEEVLSWDDNKILAMTVGTNVYLKSRIKISNAMEDLEMDIFI